MAISNLGISRNDFENQAFDDFKELVTRTPKIKSVSESGSQIYTSGTSEQIYAIFRKRSSSYDWAKEGLFEDGDMFIQVKQDQTLNKEDIITANGEDFRIDNVIVRTIGGTQMFKVANGFLQN